MQQSPQMFGMPIQQQQPTSIISTEQIQKYLDENKQLIMAIMESQNLGKLNECAQYQAQLQKNLMYLAAIADAQPPAPTGPSQPQPQPQSQSQPQPQSQSQPQLQLQPQPQPQPHLQPQSQAQLQSQMHMQSAIPQGPPMQPPQPGFTQQQAAAYGARMPFMTQPYDQQSLHIQQQQTMAGMIGMRMGGPSGLHPSLQMGQGHSAHFMDARNRQDGSEAGSGDGQGK